MNRLERHLASKLGQISLDQLREQRRSLRRCITLRKRALAAESLATAAYFRGYATHYRPGQRGGWATRAANLMDAHRALAAFRRHLDLALMELPQ